MTTDSRASRTAVFLLFASNGIAAAAWASRVPGIADGLHIGIGQGGALITGLPIGSIVAILLSSHVIHLLGERATSRIAIFGQALGLVVIGIAAGTIGNYGLAFVGFVIFGLANSLNGIVINVAAADIDRTSARTLMPLFHATFSVGTFVGAGAGSLAVLAGVPVFIHLPVAAVVLVVLSLIAVRRLPESGGTAAAAAPSTFADRMRVWTEPRTLLIGIIIVGAAFAEGTANNWLALAMVEDRGLTEAVGAAYLTIFTGSMMVGRFGGGFLVDRFGRTATLRGALLLAVGGVLLVVFIGSPVGTVAGVVLWGIGASLGYPLSVSSAADSPINAAARVSAGRAGIPGRSEHRGAHRAAVEPAGRVPRGQRPDRGIPRGIRGVETSRRAAGARRPRCGCRHRNALTGRLSAHLPIATRLLVVKADGSVIAGPR